MHSPRAAITRRQRHPSYFLIFFALTGKKDLNDPSIYGTYCCRSYRLASNCIKKLSPVSEEKENISQLKEFGNKSDVLIIGVDDFKLINV